MYLAFGYYNVRLKVVPSVLFSAVVYGVPIIYTAGIVAEFVFTTFFKPTKQVRPRAADKNLEVNALLLIIFCPFF